MILSYSVLEIAKDLLIALLVGAGGVAVLIVWGYFHRPKK